MRSAFKKQADQNTAIIQEHLGEFVEGTWILAQKCSNVIDSSLCSLPASSAKEAHIITLLRNTVSDLCCCLDVLERGAERTLVNNLRMTFEDYCLGLQVQFDPKAYHLFLKEDLQTPKAVTFAKNLKIGFEDFGILYRHFSKISHNSQLELLARQVVSIQDGVVQYTHLKTINPNCLIPQISNLSFIAFLLMEIGLLVEEICISQNTALHFGEKTTKGYKKRLDTPGAIFLIKLLDKAEVIFS